MRSNGEWYCHRPSPTPMPDRVRSIRRTQSAARACTKTVRRVLKLKDGQRFPGRSCRGLSCPLLEWIQAAVAPSRAAPRRDGRVAEGARLESVFRGNSNVGSNPTLSASNSRKLLNFLQLIDICSRVIYDAILLKYSELSDQFCDVSLVLPYKISFTLQRRQRTKRCLPARSRF